MFGDAGKYICIELGGIRHAVIFNAIANHIDIARSLCGVDAPNLVSAGMIRVLPRPDGRIKVQCYGESTTLHLRSCPNEDSRACAVSLGIEFDDLYIDQESTS